MKTVDVTCPYCGDKAEFTNSSRVYNGQDFGMIYLCSNYPTCDAFVGVHKGTAAPLGRMADKELREWKKKAHATIDPYWREKGMARGHVYGAVARIMELPISEAHIGMFDVAKCKKLVERFEKEVRYEVREAN